MKILFISHKFYPDIGGIEVNSEILATQFVKFGAEVKLVTWTIEQGIKSFDFPIKRNPSVSELTDLFKWAEIVFENNPAFRLSWPNILFRKPRVVALNTWLRRSSGQTSIKDRLKRKWINQASAVIAVSQAVKKDSSKKAIVIGNPYRSSLFKQQQDFFSRKKQFVFLGRLVSDKGADMCVQLISEFKKLGKDYTLTIVGDGPERESLKRMVDEFDLNDYVEFTGFMEGNVMVEKLNQHQFILVPSKWEEPFGNVALEGMACGCIPIVSDGGGLPDAVGYAGIVFKRNDMKDMVIQTKKIVSSNEKQQKLINQASKHLQTHTHDVVAQRYFKVIKKAIE